MTRLILPSSLVALALVVSPHSASAEEGMWLFNQFPADKVQAAYGWKPDAAWLDAVRLASVRLEGGCSGSFVSKSGLVMTNHHCAESCIDELSSPKNDYRTNGYYAEQPAMERRCPNMAMAQLVAIEDVTARVQAAGAGKTDQVALDAMKAEKATIEAGCPKGPTTRCEVVELYDGGKYDLYTYQRYEDVRLVFAPEFRAAFFGGDPDNFEFPRYCLDATFFRVYQDGKPLDTPSHFTWSESGTREGDLTFVSGHPGSTSRLQTLSEIETWRDYGLVSRIAFLSELRGALRGYAHRGKEQARHSMGTLFGVENGLKAFKGEFEALREPGLMKQLRDNEASLRAKAAGTDVAGSWDAIAAAQEVWKTLIYRHRLIESGRGFSSDLLSMARVLVRGTAELAKPNTERLREYTESALPGLKQDLFSEAPIYKEFEIFRLAWSLDKLREILGPDDAFVKTVLGKESPEQLAKRVIAGTKLHDVALRRKLFEGGAAAAAASTDPLIVLARLIDPEARTLRKRYEDEVEAVLVKSHASIAKARFQAFGHSIYPDATFTLRLSYGSVRGYVESGQPVAPYTTLGGAFDRHTGADPFRLPDSWLANKAALDLTVPYNLVTTNDIIGGNSGSPVIDKERRIVGLIFDGNIQSLGGDYGFDAAVNRAVAVDARGILHTAKVIYRAERLVIELLGGP